MTETASSVKTPVLDKPRFVGATQTALPIRHPSELPVTTDTRIVLMYKGKELLVRVDRIISAEDFEGEILSLDHSFKPLGDLRLGDRIRFSLSDITWIDRPPFERLVESGVPKEQARTFLELLDDAKAGQLDPPNAHARLIGVGYPEPQAEALLQTLREVSMQSSRLR